MTFVVVLTLLASLCFLVASYAFWDSSFHLRNVTRILDGEPRKEHQTAVTRWICKLVTGGVE